MSPCDGELVARAVESSSVTTSHFFVRRSFVVVVVGLLVGQ